MTELRETLIKQYAKQAMLVIGDYLFTLNGNLMGCDYKMLSKEAFDWAEAMADEHIKRMGGSND